MTSNTPQQTLFEEARAEVATQEKPNAATLGTFRTAHLKELKEELDNLKVVQRKANLKVDSAFKLSDQRIVDLEASLQAEKVRCSSQTDKYNTTFSKLRDAKRALDESQSQHKTLQEDLDAAKQRNIDLQAELKLAKSQPPDLQQRLEAVEKMNVDLQADLKAARQQASTAEDELKAFKIRFNKINDLVSSLGSSLAQEQPRPAASPAMSFTPQDSVEESHNASQVQDHDLQTLGLNSHTSPTTSDKESDLQHCQKFLDEVMDVKNSQYNRYFLKTLDSPTLARLDAKIGPMDLGTMKEKLAKGAYTSDTSFKADLELMIADCMSLNPTNNLVRTAAETLMTIFARYQSPDSASSTQVAISKKRKAETGTLLSPQDEHIQKRRSLAPLEKGITDVQSVDPGTAGSFLLALYFQNQFKDNSRGPQKPDTHQMKAQMITGTLFSGIDATLSTVAQLVSVTRSPSTISGHWRSLVPDSFRLTAHTAPSDVEKIFSDTWHERALDMIILRVKPAAEADQAAFNHLFTYFLQKKKFAIVDHTGTDNVVRIDLIPASRAASYPGFLSSLDLDCLPPAKTEDVLFMAIIFMVAEHTQERARRAWDRRMRAIRYHHKGCLISMRVSLVRNHLPIFRDEKTVFWSTERHLASLSHLPYSEKSASPGLQAHAQGVLRISCPQWNRGSRPSVCGVAAPEWVFVLGGVVDSGKSLALVVIDIQEKDRPLWLVCHHLVSQGNLRVDQGITLLASKFPGSLSEWEDIIPARLSEIPRQRCPIATQLTLERCKPTD